MPFPERNHRVDRFDLGIGLILIGIFFFSALFKLHLDRIPNIGRVFFDELRQAILLKILAVVLVLRIVFELQNDVRAVRVALRSGDGETLRAFTLPLVGFLGAVCAANDGNALCDHEGGIKADAELTDDLGLLLVHRVFFFKAERAAVRDRAEVLHKLFPRHAAAVVGDRQCTVRFIRVDLDTEVACIHSCRAIGQRAVIELVDRIAGVADQLAQEDFFMGIDGIDHEVKKPLGFGLKLLQCHIFTHPYEKIKC